ncbi:MAG: hypothetical protein IJ690_07595 [Clostridia bacterium]|nr:hypothetical protein [Clostridia bacterium]MBR1654769.1 hypothetical protein [Clostridia bacterium]
MNEVYKWFEDNIYYSVNSGKASIYLENDDLFEFENMLKELVTDYTNLQSKIDKAIEYIDDLCKCSDGTYFNYGDDLSPKHIVDILKEKK